MSNDPTSVKIVRHVVLIIKIGGSSVIADYDLIMIINKVKRNKVCLDLSSNHFEISGQREKT